MPEPNFVGFRPEAFRFLTVGIELPGPYQGRSVTFKELERRADHMFEPDNGAGPTYIIAGIFIMLLVIPRQADAEQLEAWAERIFDANDLPDLLGPKPD